MKLTVHDLEVGSYYGIAGRDVRFEGRCKANGRYVFRSADDRTDALSPGAIQALGGIRHAGAIQQEIEHP